MTGSYEVEITFHSYDIPTGRCVRCQGQSFDSTPGCCDESFIRSSSQSCPSQTCDTGMFLCIRRLSLSDCGIFNQFAPQFNPDANNFAFTSSFFGLDNPLVVEDTVAWRVSLINILHYYESCIANIYIYLL